MEVGFTVTAENSTSTLLRVEHVSKRFGATQALHQVSLELHEGEIHGFAGENGAGKSTLAKIISGLYQQDSGEIYVDGDRVTKWDTARAQHRGVVLIAQELSLVPEMSVAQNVFLGIESNRLGVLSDDLQERYQLLEESIGFGLDPQKRLGSLSIAERQKVEIMRALARDARIIIMDEPTSSLTADEVDKLHTIIQKLKSQGRTIIYVTHFLESLLEICDRVTVMRDGQIVKTSDASNETKVSIVEYMLGRSLSHTFPERSAGVEASVTPKLELRNVSTQTGVRNVSLTVRPGEIVGLAGLVGSGRTEIARAIFGVDPVIEGEIFIDGKPYDHRSPRQSVEQGIALIPEDRRAQGLVMVRSVRENISLPHLQSISVGKVLRRRVETKRAKELVNNVSITPPRIAANVSDFSGGNQQKVLFAKWLMGNPSLIILDEPTRGVDIGAKVTIYEIIAELARRGAAILLISSEHTEVLELSHRVHLVRNGTIAGELDPRVSSVDDLLFKLFGLENELSEGR
ncbi:MAG: sugar ABC transporter ATP-binding protein [Actinobacteria bacterium]|nr:sugar ABC transporter ATP-binding protein [Actinomycetota bacterium]NBP91918.1 sugar ABC transporter ATP-binding protein [Actinomycetota bacterium]